jgi:hypothetical protein
MAKAPCPSQVIVVRYADNIVMGFEHDQALCWRSAPEVDEIVEIKCTSVFGVARQIRDRSDVANSKRIRRALTPDPRAHQHAGAPFVRDAGGGGEGELRPLRNPADDPD